MNVDALKRTDLDRLIRYGYSGFLLTGIFLFLVPDRVHPALEAGGTVVSPLVILAGGAAVYTLYRYVLNEMFLSPIILHPLHSLVDWIGRRDEPSNPANFLAKHNVHFLLRHQAYIEIRRGFFDEEQRRAFDRNHTEATVVWLTAVECTIAGAILLRVGVGAVPLWKSWMLLCVGISTLVAAILMDIRLFQQECRILKTRQNDLPKFLRDRGFIDAADDKASSQQTQAYP